MFGNKRKSYDTQKTTSNRKKSCKINLHDHDKKISDDVVQTIVEHQSSLEKLVKHDLGFDDKTIFKETKESQIASKNFMQSFWSFEDNLRATVEFQHYKNEKKSYKTPSCLTFTLAELKNPINSAVATVCFLTMSGEMNSKIKPILYQHSTYMNSHQSETSYWVTAPKNIMDYNILLSSFVSKKVETTRPCSEKFQIAVVSSMYAYCHEHKYEFNVQGSTNISFYPFLMPTQLLSTFSSTQASLNYLLEQYKFTHFEFNDVAFNERYKSEAILVDGLIVDKDGTNHTVFLLSLICCDTCQDLLACYRLLIMAAKVGLISSAFLDDRSKNFLQLPNEFKDVLKQKDFSKNVYLEELGSQSLSSKQECIDYTHPSNPYSSNPYPFWNKKDNRQPSHRSPTSDMVHSFQSL